MLAPMLRDSLSDQGSAVGGGSGEVRPDRVLVVEDDPAMVRTLECYFANRRLLVVDASTIADAKRLYSEHRHWSLVISDFHLPDGSGWDFCGWLRRQSGDVAPFLLISGAAAATGFATQVAFLAKPFSIGQLDRAVGALLAPSRRFDRELSKQTEA